MGTKEAVRFRHLMFKLGGGVTIAYQNELEERTKEVSFGLAFCNPGGQYWRKIGRGKALRKLDEEPITFRLSIEESSPKHIIQMVMNGVNVRQPNWLKKMIRDDMKMVSGEFLRDVLNLIYEEPGDEFDKNLGEMRKKYPYSWVKWALNKIKRPQESLVTSK